MQASEALAELLIIRLALLEIQRQLFRIDHHLEGNFGANTDRPLDEEARIRSAASLALDELVHVLKPIERITGGEDTGVIELEDGVRSSLLEAAIGQAPAEDR
ncbi:MAG: hypothetical protein AAGM22_30810 [Acidobacteriota bacterium]